MDRRDFLAAAAAGGLALAVDPHGLVARAGGGDPVALVTADLESHVVAVGLESGRILERLRTAPGPRSIESVGANGVVVGHTEVGLVSVLSLSSRGLRRRAEVDGFEEPRYMAIHPRWPYAYVTDSAREEVVTLLPGDGRILGRTRVPGPARHVSISPDGRTIWVALGSTAARVAVLDASDPRRPKLVRTMAPPFLAHDVVFAPDGRTVWVSSGDERRIALYGSERRPARILAAGAPPQHVAFASRKAFVAAGKDGTLRRHTLDGELVREARIPVGSYNVAFGLGCVVSPSLGHGTVSVLDRNGRIRSVQRIARATHDACVVIPS